MKNRAIEGNVFDDLVWMLGNITAAGMFATDETPFHQPQGVVNRRCVQVEGNYNVGLAGDLHRVDSMLRNLYWGSQSRGLVLARIHACNRRERLA